MGTTSTARIEWACDECGGRIEDGDGWIDLPRAWWKTAGTSRWDGTQGHWRARHSLCIPEGDKAHYECEIDRFRSWAALADWTVHILTTKTWGPQTDWASALRLRAEATIASGEADTLPEQERMFCLALEAALRRLGDSTGTEDAYRCLKPVQGLVRHHHVFA